jgi:hypothetical protein
MVKITVLTYKIYIITPLGRSVPVEWILYPCLKALHIIVSYFVTLHCSRLAWVISLHIAILTRTLTSDIATFHKNIDISLCNFSQQNMAHHFVTSQKNVGIS